ncbi:hypothetical protein ACQ86G_15805 [Roseateles chitinivorans]|uniref:hypothetical protein n=1 Tax=Roseateles chitinivorans TaxID=2917965 RepID=UPI003D66DE00
MNEAKDMGNLLSGQYGGAVTAQSTDQGAIRNLNPTTIGAAQRPENFHDKLASSTVDALLNEVGGQAAGAVLKVLGRAGGASYDGVISLLGIETKGAVAGTSTSLPYAKLTWNSEVEILEVTPKVSSGFPTEADELEFKREGQCLKDRLQAELGARSCVTLVV